MNTERLSQFLEGAEERSRQLSQSHLPDWPNQILIYKNRKTGNHYKPHHEKELQFITDKEHRYLLAKGGEGGGKSVAGIIRDLERIKVGANGIMGSPDFEHFKKSLWPEFRRWCPWEYVVPSQQYRQHFSWEPGRPFQLAFTTGAVVYCGGMKESDIMAWEGPNVNWAHFDEGRRHKTPVALKVLDGRVRIPVDHPEHGYFPPQMWLTTTPRKHWLYEFFGPWEGDGIDPKAEFKAHALVITLLTRDNEENLEPGFVDKRRLSLTEAEARVLLEAEWEDVEDTQRFLPSMTLWDLREEKLPALSNKEPMVVAMDAAIGGTGLSSSFGMVGTTRHPERHEDVAVRYVRKWDAPPGKKIDFGAEDGPEKVLRMLCRDFDVVVVPYDPYQLHDMATRLNKENVAWFFEFSQGQRRLESDRQLLDLILQRRISHNGDADLREHISNANRKLASDDRRLRIVKREAGMNNDLAVCLSMSAYENLRLNL